MLVRFIFSWPEWNIFSSRNVGHSVMECPCHIALSDRKSKAGILYSMLRVNTKHENKYGASLNVKLQNCSKLCNYDSCKYHVRSVDNDKYCISSVPLSPFS